MFARQIIFLRCALSRDTEEPRTFAVIPDQRYAYSSIFSDRDARILGAIEVANRDVARSVVVKRYILDW